jgi:hypothetical protein
MGDVDAEPVVQRQTHEQLSLLQPIVLNKTRGKTPGTKGKKENFRRGK